MQTRTSYPMSRRDARSTSAVACCVATLLACLPLVGRAADAPWQPAKGPLFARWAKDVSPDKALPEYPRPQMVRKDWQNLNGLWDYAITPKAETPPENYEGKILVPWPVESALSGVMKPVDAKSNLWYHRTFEVPKNWAGQVLLLHFGAVDWETTVWVNGKQLDPHRGGYDGFTFDVTAAVKTDGPQELVVRVWDPTDKGTQPRGKQVSHPGASCTRRAPASGRRCGWSRCRSPASSR